MGGKTDNTCIKHVLSVLSEAENNMLLRLADVVVSSSLYIVSWNNSTEV